MAVNNVNNLNQAASQLLDQIKKLSAQKNQKQDENIFSKNKIADDHATKIRDMIVNAKLGGVEKKQGKSEVFAQLMKNVVNENSIHNASAVDVVKVQDLEKRRYRNPLGSFLDVYL